MDIYHVLFAECTSVGSHALVLADRVSEKARDPEFLVSSLD